MCSHPRRWPHHDQGKLNVPRRLTNNRARWPCYLSIFAHTLTCHMLVYVPRKRWQYVSTSLWEFRDLLLVRCLAAILCIDPSCILTLVHGHDDMTVYSSNYVLSALIIYVGDLSLWCILRPGHVWLIVAISSSVRGGGAASPQNGKISEGWELVQIQLCISLAATCHMQAPWVKNNKSEMYQFL